MKTLAQLDKESQDFIHHLADVTSFPGSLDELVRDIKRAYPNAKMGRPMYVSNTGEEYREIGASALCRNREYDIGVVKKHVLKDAARQFHRLATDKVGDGFNLYWRILPEEDLAPVEVVEHYAEHGPDKEFMTGRRCYLDKGWVRYGVYMRLLISGRPELPEN